MTNLAPNHTLTHISIHGYRSIQSLQRLPLSQINILIGANGAGKSNFVGFFESYSKVAGVIHKSFINLGQNLSYSKCNTLLQNDDIYFKGSENADILKVCLESDLGKISTATPKIGVAGDLIEIDTIDYKFVGRHTKHLSSQSAHNFEMTETKRATLHTPSTTATALLLETLANCTVYHFHNAVEAIAGPAVAATNQSDRVLAHDGSNIALFLRHVKKENEIRYEKILNTIQMTAPFFGDFVFDSNTGPNTQFHWKQKGVDNTFSSLLLSDGTLRFICMAAALLQPDPPKIIVFDEPELGLHPFAIHLLAEMIHMAAEDTQVIVSTQSSVLIDSFTPEDIIVVEREQGASKFKRLSSNELELWLKDYTLDQLWQKNTIGGGPRGE